MWWTERAFFFDNNTPRLLVVFIFICEHFVFFILLFIGISVLFEVFSFFFEIDSFLIFFYLSVFQRALFLSFFDCLFALSKVFISLPSFFYSFWESLLSFLRLVSCVSVINFYISLHSLFSFYFKVLLSKTVSRWNKIWFCVLILIKLPLKSKKMDLVSFRINFRRYILWNT